MLRVLDETLTYEIDQILIVEPEDMTPLAIVEGMDYCTLVTCTPYGLNTHRMLVRGHRIENAEEARSVLIIAEMIQIEPLIVSACVGVPMLVSGNRKMNAIVDRHNNADPQASLSFGATAHGVGLRLTF